MYGSGNIGATNALRTGNNVFGYSTLTLDLLKAFLPDASEKLSVFIGLIITNCIIMGRLEAFAMGNKVWNSFLDALGNALAYGWILVAVAFVGFLFFEEVFPAIRRSSV